MNKLAIGGLYILFAVIIALLGYIASKAYYISSIESRKGKTNFISTDSIYPSGLQATQRTDQGLANKNVDEVFNIDIPLNEEHVKSQYILSWAAFSVAEIMSFGYHDHKVKLANSSKYFTKKGWKDYSAGLYITRAIEMVEANKHIVKAAPKGAPTLESKGVYKDKYQWVIKLPMSLTYRNDNGVKNASKVVTVVIVRSDDTLHSDGIAIDQWLAVGGQ